MYERGGGVISSATSSLLLLSILLTTPATPATLQWKAIQPGVELGVVRSLHIVRIDPIRAKVRVALASETGGASRTAAEWCRVSRFAVAINLGMFQPDGRSNVGYLRHGTHQNNPRWNDYRSVLAIGPAMQWLDLDQKKPGGELDRFNIVVQNLRLIAGNRRNVWAQSPRRWSEAAIAKDSAGRLLFLFSRAPYSMRDFNDMILALPLEITQAMHVEGGPEASLSIHAGGIDLDLSGSFESGFREDDTNHQQWPIPNVLGVLREQ
ncbi:MAG: phosphodiester glycosidase family protein [Thermoanaerobaculia bacterium]